MIFKKKLIDYRDESIVDWKMGIQIGSQLLINNHYVSEAYINEIINVTNNHGPYYIIAPKIALLHVAPNPEIKENTISFTYFKKPIVFKVDPYYHVNVCLALVTKDSDSHMDILQAVANLFVQEKFLTDLAKCDNKKELIKVIKRYDR